MKVLVLLQSVKLEAKGVTLPLPVGSGNMTAYSHTFKGTCLRGSVPLLNIADASVAINASTIPSTTFCFIASFEGAFVHKGQVDF